MTAEVVTPLNVPKKLGPGSIGGLPLIKAGDEVDAPFNCMIYGYPGTGKTRLAGSADEHPLLRPVLYIDYEAGIKPVKSMYPDVKVLKVQSWDEMQAVYNDLFRNDCHGFRTIVIDTLSELQKLSMMKIMDRVVVRAEDEGKVREEEVPDRREYLINLEQMRKMVRAFRNLPVNFICCVHAQDDRDQKTGKIQKKPALSGKLALELPGYFDAVLFTYVTEGGDEEPIYCALAKQSGSIIAKDRSNNLPQVIGLEADQPLLMKYIYTTYSEDAA